MTTRVRRLADQGWTTLPDRPTVLVPVGSLEQHGPHLPLDTDTTIAGGVADAVAAQLGGDDVLVAPPISYGASGEHQTFPGTSSIGQDALQHNVIELVRSMTTWAARIVLINGHGGNQRALTETVTRLRGEGRDVVAFACAADGLDAHAGRAETSLMLCLRPEAVRLESAAAGNCAPLRELMPMLVSAGVEAVSANGVLGDPAGADAVEGEQLLRSMATRILDRLAGGHG